MSMLSDESCVSFRQINTAQPAVTMTTLTDGAVILRDPRPFDLPSWTLLDRLQHWGNVAPDRIMLAERGPDGEWVRVSYGEMFKNAGSIAQALLSLGLRPGDSMLLLSGNSIEHATLALGAMMVGIVVAPVSPAYSLFDGSYGRLRDVARIAAPRLIFVQDGVRFKRALEVLNELNTIVVVAQNPTDGRRTHLFSDLLACQAGSAVVEARKKVGFDTIAKLLFTSGSTGRPKAVPNTHRMMASNLCMGDAVLGWKQSESPDETLCWLPWNHTMAGNVIFNANLHHGETYYIDDGRPLAGEFHRTLRNWPDVSPRVYRDVPAGFAMLAEALEADTNLCRHFFARLEYLLYGGASLPSAVHDRFQALSVKTTGQRTPFFSGFGATETAPGVLQLYWPCSDTGNVGIPLPGVEVKLVPASDGRFEVRVKGPNVMPGYLQESEINAKIFDSDGFYCMGDSVRFVTPGEPFQGLRFAGRLTEDFKLLTGTFVAVSALRLAIVDALAPLARDVVITGPNAPFVGALIWPNLSACREVIGAEAASMSDELVARHPTIMQAIKALVDRHNQANPASTTRIARFLVLDTPPSIEANEITEKGYVNQSRALMHRADAVNELYRDGAHNSAAVSLS